MRLFLGCGKIWEGLYGALPDETQVLLRVMELKLVARKVGVFRIPIEFYYRFFFEKGRRKITSLALLPGDKQVHFLIEWLGCFLN